MGWPRGYGGTCTKCGDECTKGERLCWDCMGVAMGLWTPPFRRDKGGC